MKLYRFSPIADTAHLLEAIEYVHAACVQLCLQTFREHLPNAGNIGVFCHYDDEYEQLTRIREQLTESSDNVDQKYYRLYEPIVISARNDVPQTTYTHLYIRKPDPYRHHVGDLDFYVEPGRYATLKQSLRDGAAMKGARLFDRTDLDMIELYNPDIDALAYVSTKKMTQTVHINQEK